MTSPLQQKIKITGPSMVTANRTSDGIVIYRTAQLYTNPRRRIVETSQMIIDVMQEGGLEPGGYGVRTAQKVRLMHAGVRHLLLQRDWNPAWGVPINQEDLAGTLASFSAMVLDGLMKLQTKIQNQKQAL